MILMGIDASTKDTGYSIFDNSKLIKYGNIAASSSDVIARISKITKELQQILTQYHPDKVYIEDIMPADVHNNIEIYKKLTYLQGFIVTILHSLNIPYVLITASHWRKACGIKTGAKIKRATLKEEDINFVAVKFGITTNDDIADAIGIGWCGVLECGGVS